MTHNHEWSKPPFCLEGGGCNYGRLPPAMFWIASSGKIRRESFQSPAHLKSKVVTGCCADCAMSVAMSTLKVRGPPEKNAYFTCSNCRRSRCLSSSVDDGLRSAFGIGTFAIRRRLAIPCGVTKLSIALLIIAGPTNAASPAPCVDLARTALKSSRKPPRTLSQATRRSSAT